MFVQQSMYGLVCLEAEIVSNGQSVYKLILLKSVRETQSSQLCFQKEIAFTVVLMTVGIP